MHPHPCTRRSFLHVAGGGAAAALLAPALLGQTPAAPAAPRPAGKGLPKPPALPPDRVQAVVGASHRDLEAVRKLVDETPLLVNACWDWGGGDFETPLEAAAHTGRRPIAEFLLSRGARPSLYAAAMLGQLPLVQAFLAIDPQAHAVPGPHGFTVMHCAIEGGDPAKPVVEWLRAQGVSDETFRPLLYVWPAGTEPKAS